jgi:hypothetical protein
VLFELPSPKFHSRDTASVDLSVKPTVKGIDPFVMFASKEAFDCTGALTFM